MSKLIIGLTGGIGSGKSEATKCFEALGVTAVDADIVSREVVEPGSQALKKIREHFGDEIIVNGNLDRAKLRTLIFADTEKKRWLENLLHPLINQSITEQLKSASSSYAILVSPLLFETQQHKMTDKTLLIDSSETQQIQRTTARDNNSSEQVASIIASQMSRSDKQALADDILINDTSLDELESKVKSLHQHYLQLALTKHD